MASFPCIFPSLILLFHLNYVQTLQQLVTTPTNMATLTCASGAVDFSVGTSQFVWIIQVEADHHLDIVLNKLDFKNDCGGLFIGPGGNPSINVGVLVTRPQKVRVAQPLAFIKLKNLAAGGSIQFELKCWRFKIPAQPLEPIATRFYPLKNDISEDACLKNVDNQVLQELMKGDSELEKRFESKVTSATIEILKLEENCWKPKEDTVFTHINWPLFIERIDKTDENSLFLVCFKVTVKVTSSMNCTIHKYELQKIVGNLGGIMGEIEATPIEKKPDFFALLAFGIAILTLTTALFTVVWFKKRHELLMSFSKKVNDNSWLPISPVRRVNPVHGMELEGDDESESSSIQQSDWKECWQSQQRGDGAGPSSEGFTQVEYLQPQKKQMMQPGPSAAENHKKTANQQCLEEGQQLQQEQKKQLEKEQQNQQQPEKEQQKQQQPEKEQQKQQQLEKEQQKQLLLQQEQKKQQLVLQQLQQEQEEQQLVLQQEQQKQVLLQQEQEKKHQVLLQQEEQEKSPKQTYQQEFELNVTDVSGGLTTPEQLPAKSPKTERKDNAVHFNTTVECLIFDAEDDDETYL